MHAHERALAERIPGKPAAAPVIPANSISEASAAAAAELASALDNAAHVHTRPPSFPVNPERASAGRFASQLSACVLQPSLGQTSPIRPQPGGKASTRDHANH